MDFLQSPRRQIPAGFFFISIFFLNTWALSGCATIAGAVNPRVTADRMAMDAGLSKESVQGGQFKLTAYSRLGAMGNPLTVFIEGDGRAWYSKYRLSEDPTPFHPVGLELATADRSVNVLYLARPCQYTGRDVDDTCKDPAYWSDKRFSEEVIACVNEAISAFSEKIRATGIHMVGYSGGAAVAVLVSARRKDVLSLITVAGNLDTEFVNRYHGVDPLKGSLNPMDFVSNVSAIPQHHFSGSKDGAVPPVVAERFVQAVNSVYAKAERIAGASHRTGWKERWPDLSKRLEG